MGNSFPPEIHKSRPRLKPSHLTEVLGKRVLSGLLGSSKVTIKNTFEVTVNGRPIVMAAAYAQGVCLGVIVTPACDGLRPVSVWRIDNRPFDGYMVATSLLKSGQATYPDNTPRVVATTGAALVITEIEDVTPECDASSFQVLIQSIKTFGRRSYYTEAEATSQFVALPEGMTHYSQFITLSDLRRALKSLGWNKNRDGRWVSPNA